MPTVSPSAWGPKPAFFLSSGLPAVGYQLFAYLAGSVGTKQPTYTDSTGAVANTNPLVLDTNGTPTDEWWWDSTLTYKIVYAPAADTDPPASPIWTIDNVRGIGAATITPSEWVASSLVPTFISGTSFSLIGDQTATFQVGRRVKSTVTAGTIYSTIATSVFGAVTTVTLVNDSGVLDAGLSAVAYGIISSINTSDPFQGSTGIPASIIDAKGDLVTGTANDAPAVLTAGTNGTYLAADSTQSTGLIWRAAQLNTVPAAKSSAYPTVLADYGTRLEVTGTTTISLGDAATMGAGYFLDIANVGTGVVTVALVTAGNTLQGVAAGSLTLAPKSAVRAAVNAALTGYIITATAAQQANTPNTQTGTTYTVLPSDTSLIINAGATCTLTLLAAATYPGRILRVRTIAAFTVVSATSNVVPAAGGAAGTAILAATAGKWADLQSNGTAWEIMASN